jgi:hypothetical protein
MFVQLFYIVIHYLPAWTRGGIGAAPQPRVPTRRPSPVRLIGDISNVSGRWLVNHCRRMGKDDHQP